MPDISEEWSNQMYHMTDGEYTANWWLQTSSWDLGLYGWVSVQLEAILRIRELDLTNSKVINLTFVNWNGYTINDAFLSVGYSL
jgi:hypothetical protein